MIKIFQHGRVLRFNLRDRFSGILGFLPGRELRLIEQCGFEPLLSPAERMGLNNTTLHNESFRPSEGFFSEGQDPSLTTVFPFFIRKDFRGEMQEKHRR
jgi:hypothetical protein